MPCALGGQANSGYPGLDGRPDRIDWIMGPEKGSSKMDSVWHWKMAVGSRAGTIWNLLTLGDGGVFGLKCLPAQWYHANKIPIRWALEMGKDYVRPN